MILSVIIPVYNGEQHIDNLVETLKKQQFTDMEAILVDDGSKDDTWKKCQYYSSQYPWLHVIHTENHGVSHARNTGLDAAEGEWIQFLDADDILEPGMMDHFLATVTEYQVDMAVCGCNRICGDAKAVPCGPKESRILNNNEKKQLFDGLKMEDRYWLLDYVWNKWYKKSVIDNCHLRFPENMSLSEDFVFNTKYMQHMNGLALIKECYYRYQVGDSGLVSRFQPEPWIGRMYVYNGHKELYQKMGLWKTNKNEIISQTGQIGFGDMRMINSPRCSLSNKEKLEFVDSMIQSPLFVMILTYLRTRKSLLFRIYYTMLRIRNKRLIYTLIQIEKIVK